MRKILTLTGLALVTLWIWHTSSAGSYRRTFWRVSRPNLEDSLPLSVQIERAEALLADLTKIQDQLICRQAQLAVAARELEQQIQRDREEIGRERAWLQAQSDYLRDQSSHDLEPSRDKRLTELGRRLQLLQQRESLLQRREQLLAEQRRALSLLQEKRRQLQFEQAELATRIAQLKTSLELVRLGQNCLPPVSAESSADELTELRRLLNQTEKRLEAELLVLKLRRQASSPTIPLDDSDTGGEVIDW